MKRGLVGLAVAGAVTLTAGLLHNHLHHRLFGHRSAPMTHSKSEFTFIVQAPLTQAFPLFGPEGERPWAGPHWDPQFVYPKPAQDIEGAVFRIHHGHHEAIWVNTAFDAKVGHAAYTYVIEGKLATRIDVRLTSVSPQTTSVKVMYERTALDPSVEDDVGEMAQADPTMGPEWEKAIAEYLGRH